MSETLNVNVLVAAKEEYTKQLVNSIQSSVYDIIKDIYSDSQKNNIRRNVSYSNFQKELKAVPNWTTFKLEEKLQYINSKFPYLMDLITAIFVSHVKILACVRLKSDNKSVKIKVPNLNTFLHKIIINCCETIYYNPEIIEDSKSVIFDIINTSIHDTIANQIPIEYILNEYLSGVFDEEEPSYPQQDNIYEEEPELNEFSDEEESEEKRNIPIIPIQKPISKGIQPGTLKDELPLNIDKPQNDNSNPVDEMKDFKELKNNKDNNFLVNKQEEINDDEDYEDDEDDFDDEEDDFDDPSDKLDDKSKNEPTLF